MPAWAEVFAAAERDECFFSLFALVFGEVIGVEEAVGVEGLGVGAPDGFVVVEDRGGHLDDAVFLEEVAVV